MEKIAEQTAPPSEIRRAEEYVNRLNSLAEKNQSAFDHALTDFHNSFTLQHSFDMSSEQHD